MQRPRPCGPRSESSGGSSRFRNEISASWEMSTGSTSSSWRAARPTSRPGSLAPGAAAVAVDLSGEQLATARRLQGRLGPTFPLVQADAERVPLASGRFDLVLSEHGAAAWCDPERWLPEAARLLRPGGRLVFLTNSYLSALCVRPRQGLRETGCCAVSGRPTACSGRRRDRVPSLAWRLDPAVAGLRLRGRGHARDLRARGPARPCRSTRSCRASGRPGGRPRSSGWPAARRWPT